MNWWFTAIVLLNVLSLGIHLGNHGKKEEKKYNFWAQLFGSAIGLTLIYMAIKTGF